MIYYVGYRESDIAVGFDACGTDPFFAGSITCYGSNENGNIAYNATTGMQFQYELYSARNSGSGDVRRYSEY